MGESGDVLSEVYPISQTHSVDSCCLSVFHLNINRLRNKIHHLEALLEAELQIRPCFVCITETWFMLGEEINTYLPGYRIIVNCCRSNSRGVGVLFLLGKIFLIAVRLVMLEVITERKFLRYVVCPYNYQVRIKFL